MVPLASSCPRILKVLNSNNTGLGFSAKEAFSKAIGMGMRMPMTWRSCEIAKEASGKPCIVLHGALKEWFDARRLSAHVSVTDETDYAASFVVIEQRG